MDEQFKQLLNRINPLYRVVEFPAGYFEIQKRFCLFFWTTERDPENEFKNWRFDTFMSAKSQLYPIRDAEVWLREPLLIQASEQ